MKKTISITIGGSMFTIEEDAYQALDAYITSIRDHYKADDAADEIVADIESSIAEKFSDRTEKQKRAVTKEDVEAVIAVMGRVEEIVGEDESGEREARAPEGDRGEAPRRLYRDPDDSVVAGVCSGIAAYFSIDPLFVRVLFIVLAFMDGFGILLYLLLWIVTQKAETGAQKLEMRGRRVSIAEIQEVVRERSEMIGAESKEALGRLRNSSTLYRIISFPIRVIEVLFRAARRVISVLGPAVSVIVGVCISVPTGFAIAVFTVIASMMLFNIDAPYRIADLPIRDLASEPIYFVGVIAFYFVCVVPLLFIMTLGGSLIKRKNQFRIAMSAVLIAIWILSLAVSAVAAGKLIPWVHERVAKLNETQTVERTYDVADFTKLYIGGDQDITIKQGEGFSIRYVGRVDDLERLRMTTEDGQLQIVQTSGADDDLCIFCKHHRVTAEIVMPTLDSYVGIGGSDVMIEGFSSDMYVSLGESARADISLHGQNLEGKLSGAWSDLTLFGEASDIHLEMDGGSGLTTQSIQAGTIVLVQSVFSHTKLEGEAEALSLELTDSARADAEALEADSVTVRMHGSAEAFVFPHTSLEGTITDASTLRVYGAVSTEDVKTSNMSQIITE